MNKLDQIITDFNRDFIQAEIELGIPIFEFSLKALYMLPTCVYEHDNKYVECMRSKYQEVHDYLFDRLIPEYLSNPEKYDAIMATKPDRYNCERL